MTPEQAIQESQRDDLTLEELKKINSILIRAYRTKKNFSKVPQILLQTSVEKFFQDIDSNGVGEKWATIQIEKVRQFFLKNFRGIYKIPLFPCITEETKKIRESILNEEKNSN